MQNASRVILMQPYSQLWSGSVILHFYNIIMDLHINQNEKYSKPIIMDYWV